MADSERPPGGVIGWRRLHGDLRPSALVTAWVQGMQRIAATKAIGQLPPDLLSAAGVGAAAVAIVVSAAGGRWPLLAATLVLLVGLLDGLDGAVALASGRARPLGAVVDAMCDRIGDLALVGVLVALGAPPAWCAMAAAFVLLHEYLRSNAQAVGMRGIGALTVAERPTRLVLVAVACLGTAVLPTGTPWTGWGWATVTAAGWIAVGAVGLGQLGLGVARTLRSAQYAPRSGGPDHVGDDPG